MIKGRAFIRGRLERTSVHIKDGRIAAIGGTGGRDEIDVGDRMILPGFIDPHVHFRDPGMTHKEDFSSGTLGALHAGVTCVLDMPNTSPSVTTLPALEGKKAAISGRAYTDYGLFAAVMPETDVDVLSPHVAGFKLFMGPTTGHLIMDDPSLIRRKFDEIARTGRAVSVHAEAGPLIGCSKESGNADHLRNRPVDAELSAIRELAGYGGRVNICHVTSRPGARTASEAGFTTEVTAHHLLLDCPEDADAYYKVNPPLRDRGTRRMLLSEFRAGGIDMIGSDHAPHAAEEKAADYDAAPSGISCVEETMPLFLNMVRTGELALGDLVRMASENPARTFGMNKGRIEKGYDADLVVVDMGRTGRITASDLHTRSGHTVYEGWDAVFPEMVMVRGNIQIMDGEFRGKAIGRDIRG